MPPGRLPGPAARQGALAGAIAGAIGGAVGLVIAIGVATVFAPLAVLGEADQILATFSLTSGDTPEVFILGAQ